MIRHFAVIGVAFVADWQIGRRSLTAAGNLSVTIRQLQLSCHLTYRIFPSRLPTYPLNPETYCAEKLLLGSMFQIIRNDNLDLVHRIRSRERGPRSFLSYDGV
jgi:hypothetical protein